MPTVICMCKAPPPLVSPTAILMWLSMPIAKAIRNFTCRAAISSPLVVWKVEPASRRPATPPLHTPRAHGTDSTATAPWCSPSRYQPVVLWAPISLSPPQARQHSSRASLSVVAPRYGTDWVMWMPLSQVAPPSVSPPIQVEAVVASRVEVVFQVGVNTINTCFIRYWI